MLSILDPHYRVFSEVRQFSRLGSMTPRANLAGRPGLTNPKRQRGAESQCAWGFPVDPALTLGVRYPRLKHALYSDVK